MNIKRCLCALSVLILICICVSNEALAESRSIYIGDIITLQINTQRLSTDKPEKDNLQNEIMEKFQGFEIVEIKSLPDGYLLSLRSFNTGEHKIVLGDKEIIINVHSTLEEIERESIYEGDTWVVEPGFIFNWRILFYISAGIFILSGLLVVIKAILKGREKTLSPILLFLRRAGSLKIDADDYFVDLTFYFKEYLESLYNFRIIGKTSAEILNELTAIKALEAMLPEIRAWLMECDRMKFTGIELTKEIKNKHYNKLLGLVEKVEKNNAQKEGAV